MKKTGLGRGLDALIDTSHVDTNGSSSISEIELAKIVANPDQPRRSFDEEAMQELADSIREHGVISPITLRDNGDGTYMIIAGERRFRASKLAGLERIPAYIRTAKDEQVMEWAKLPAEIQVGIKDRLIEMGHARAILGTPSPERQLALYQRILRDGLSVRKVEALAQEDRLSKNPQAKREVNQYVALGKELSLNSGLKIKIQNNKVVISFEDEDELRRIIERIS